MSKPKTVKNLAARQQKFQSEDDFDSQLSSLTVGDCQKLLELFQHLQKTQQTSCSAALNRLIKWLCYRNLIDAKFDRKPCRDIYRNNEVGIICESCRNLTPALWRDMVMSVVFSRKMISIIQPPPDFPVTSLSANVALMATAFVHPTVVDILSTVHGDLEKPFGRSVLDEGAQTVRDNLWTQITSAVNNLAPTLTNQHREKYSELNFLNPSEGHFKDDHELRSLFTHYKSAVAILDSKFQASGHNSAGVEKDDEIYQKFLETRRREDLHVFYCYLEWAPHFNTYGWLTRSTPSSSNSSPSPTSGKKRKIEDDFFSRENLAKIQEIFKNDQLDDSFIERNKIETLVLRRQILIENMNKLEFWIENQKDFFTQEQIEGFKRKYAEYANELVGIENRE